MKKIPLTEVVALLLAKIVVFSETKNTVTTCTAQTRYGVSEQLFKSIN